MENENQNLITEKANQTGQMSESYYMNNLNSVISLKSFTAASQKHAVLRTRKKDNYTTQNKNLL